jgi:predicted MFS family arabinose efflux permease
VLSFFLFQKTRCALSLGYLGLAELIPALGFALFAGHIVDKYPKRKLLLSYATGFSLLGISLAVTFSVIQLSQINATHFALICYSAAFIIGTLKALQAPTGFSILRMLSSPYKLSKHISLNTTVWYLGAILGPLVAGALISVWPPQHITWLFTAMYLLALALSIMLKGLDEQKPSFNKDIPFWQSLSEGLRFVFSNKLILAALSLDLFAVLFGGAESMLPAVNEMLLHASSISYGWLRSAHGLGSIVLTIFLAAIPLGRNAGTILIAAVAGFGLCMLLFGLSTNFALSFALLFIGGMCDNVSVVIRQYILQIKTPQHLQGRVASVSSIFISSSNELGALESGIAASLVGLSASIVGGGIITMLVAFTVYIITRELRQFHMNPK